MTRLIIKSPNSSTSSHMFVRKLAVTTNSSARLRDGVFYLEKEYINISTSASNNAYSYPLLQHKHCSSRNLNHKVLIKVDKRKVSKLNI
jgi:hypothetical protein